MGNRQQERGAARLAAFCALRFGLLPQAVLAVAPTAPSLPAAGSPPAASLDFQAALGTVGTGNSERGISRVVRVLASDPVTFLPPAIPGSSPSLC